jgi:hypothetical protein
MNSTSPTKIRDLMPEGYLAKLIELTGCKNYSNLAQIVRNEHSTSKHWPAILRFAEETNPAGFALWAAAHPDKLPTVAVAA